MEQINLGYCIECEERLDGRLNKKFCTNICKSRYHNREVKKITGKVHQILWRNRTILQYLIEKGKTELSESEFIKLGFNLNYITRFKDQGEGITLLYVYDLGFYSPGDNTIKILNS